MNAQEVIKKFMAALDVQNFNTGTLALDDAIRQSSRFNGIQDLLNNFLSDQKAAERTAIKNILGSNYKEEYDDLQLSDLLELATQDEDLYNILNETATYSDEPTRYGPDPDNKKVPRSFTAAERIRMQTADLFLAECGIELPEYCYRAINTKTGKLMATYNLNYGATGNNDTGAITGSDAGGSTEKTPESVVPEIGNKYTAKNSRPQNISTGTNDWIVTATDYGDTITSGGADSIDAGGGNDIIYVEGENATISAGENHDDADTIYIRSNVKNVTVANLDEHDTLNIDGDFEISSVEVDYTDENIVATVSDINGRTFIFENFLSAQNAIVKVGNEDEQKLNDWIGAYPNENSSGTTLTTQTSVPSPVIVNLSDVTSIGGSFNAASNASSATYNADSDSGNVGTISNEFPNVETFTTNGVTFELWGRSSNSTTSRVTTLTLEDLTDLEKNIFAGLYKWWAKESLKLDEESIGMSFTSEGVMKNKIKVFFYSGTSGGTQAFVTGDGDDLVLGINLTPLAGITETDENGDGAISYLDRTLAHELTHAIMKANVKNFDVLPQFITEGLAELVHGIDDERVTRIWDLAAGNTTNVDTDTTAVETGTVRLEDALNLSDAGTGNEDSYAGGYMLLRYFAKKAAVQTESNSALGETVVNVKLSGKNETYYANLTGNTETATTIENDSNYSIGSAENYTYTPAAGIRQSVSASSGNWNLGAFGSYNTISSGNGSDTVEIAGAENSVNLGNGDNYIENYSDKNTIRTGSGSDTVKIFGNDNYISLGGGDDSIGFDFNSKNNDLNISGGNNYISLSGSKTTIKTGTGNDTISFVKYSNIENSAANNYIDVGAGDDSINVSATNNTINGGAGNDKIIIFSSGSSISGGDGNDYFDVYNSENTILGGNGADTIRIAKSHDVANLVIENINPAEDVLYFGNVIKSTMKKSLGSIITATFEDDEVYNVDLFFEGVELSDLKKLKVSYFEPLNDGSGSGYIRTKNLEDYLDLNPYTGWTIEGDTASYLVNDISVAEVYNLNLDGVEVVNGEIPGITIEDNFIVVEESLVSYETDFYTSENYLLKITNETNSSITSGGFNNSISVSNITQSEGYFNIYGNSGDDSITVTEVTQNGGNFWVVGNEGNDSISVSEIIQSGGIFEICGNDDNDLISVSDITQYRGYIYFNGFDNDDSILVSNVTINGGGINLHGDDDNDSISVSDITSNNSYLYVFGEDDNDSISLKNITQIGGLFNIEGDKDKDSISINNLTKNGDIYVLGGEGDDLITLSNVTQSGGIFNIYGDAGNDSISISNVTNSNGTFYIKGDYRYSQSVSGDDFISISDSKNILINSGGGNDTLVFGGEVTATIEDFSADDIISLGSAVSAATFANGVLNLGKVKLTLQNVENIFDYSNVKILNGDKTAKLGNLLGVEFWEVNTDTKTATYGDSITISGISENTTADDFEFADEKTVIISANALSKDSTVTISDGYNLELADDVTKTDNSNVWKISNGVADYVPVTVEGYGVVDNQIIYQEEIVGSSQIQVTGLKSNANANYISFDEESKTVTLAAAIVQGNVKITDGYALNFAKGTYSKTTVTGGENSDTVSNSGNKLVINTGAGDDFISLASGTSGNTLNGGAGDDSISSTKGKNIYQYASGDGNDYFIGFSENDSLQITSGSIDAWKVEDEDLIFTVGNGSITFKDGANQKIYSAIGNAKATAKIYSAEGIFNDKQTDITLRADLESAYTAPNKPAIKTIDGTATNSIQITGNSSANSILGGSGKDILSGGAGNDSIYGGSGNDSIFGDAGNDKLYGDAGDDTLSGGKGNDTLTGGDGNDVFIYENGGGVDVIADYTVGEKIIIDGTISSVTATAKDVAIKVGSGTLTIKNSAGQKITINDETKIYEKGKTYNEDKTAATVTAAGTLDSAVVTVDASKMSAAFKFTANNLSNSILSGKGADVLNGGDGNDTIFGEAGNDKLYGDNGNDFISGGAGNDSIFGGSGNDSLSGDDGNDSISGGTGNNTLTGGKGKDVFVYNGGRDLITDYKAGDDKIKIAEEIIGTVVTGNNVTFNVANGSLTIADGVGQKITTLNAKNKAVTQIYESGLTYDEKQTAVTLSADYSESYTPAKTSIKNIDGTATNSIQITGNSSANSILGGSGKDILSGGAGNDSIYGGSGNDSIFGDAGNDKLYGDAGNDTLSGGKGNDTLTGGDGNDVFIYENGGGTDVIADYTVGEKIIIDGTISSVTATAKDVAIKVGSGTLTIKNSAGQKITINDETKIYEKGKIYNENKTAETLTAAITETLASNILSVDGSTSSGALKLVANTLANSINGGKGSDSILGGGGNDTIFGNDGSDKLFGDAGNDILDGGKGNDTLYGGAGNDTLTGGDGSDVFVYESGNDTITDYAAGKDKIKFESDFTNYKFNGADVIFETANGNLTVTKGAGQKITTLDSKNKTTTQIYSNASTKTLELLYDDNFVTDEFELDSITEEKFEVTEIQNTNSEIAQDENILTFADDK